MKLPPEVACDEPDRRMKTLIPKIEKKLSESLKIEYSQLSNLYIGKLLQRIQKDCAAFMKTKGGCFDERKFKHKMHFYFLS